MLSYKSARNFKFILLYIKVIFCQIFVSKCLSFDWRILKVLYNTCCTLNCLFYMTFFKLFLIFLFSLFRKLYHPHLILETLASVKRHRERVETSSLVFPSHCLAHFPVANNAELKTSTWTTIVEKFTNKNSLWAENFIYFQLPYLRSPIVEQSELLLLRMYVTKYGDFKT